MLDQTSQALLAEKADAVFVIPFLLERENQP